MGKSQGILPPGTASHDRRNRQERRERSMRKNLLVLASTAALATISPAVAQYVAPSGFPAPSYAPPGSTAPGNMWRQQRPTANPPSDSPAQQPRQRPPNSALSGPIGLPDPNVDAGECAKGMSEETCRRRGQKYNGPR